MFREVVEVREINFRTVNAKMNRFIDTRNHILDKEKRNLDRLSSLELHLRIAVKGEIELLQIRLLHNLKDMQNFMFNDYKEAFGDYDNIIEELNLLSKEASEIYNELLLNKQELDNSWDQYYYTEKFKELFNKRFDIIDDFMATLVKASDLIENNN